MTIERVNDYMAALKAKLSDEALEELASEAATREIEIMRMLLRERRVWTDAPRLRNLYRLTQQYAETRDAFVECGVAQGGSLALMAAFAGPERLVWGFDSFEGLPDLTDGDAGSGEMLVGLRCSGDEGEQAVANTFALLGVPMVNVRIVKGWFAETIPARAPEIGPIAILRLDADFYEATRFALDMLYDRVMPGGAVVIDDYYSFEGCRRAVDEFRAERALSAELITTHPNSEAYWYA